MFKWMYIKMKTAYEKNTKEELIQAIMSLEEIECSDRCFVNECESNMAISSINDLFSKLIDLLETGKMNTDEQAKLLEIINTAKGNWKYIKNGMHRMNDCSRIPKNLEDFKRRVNNAIDDESII